MATTRNTAAGLDTTQELVAVEVPEPRPRDYCDSYLPPDMRYPRQVRRERLTETRGLAAVAE